MFVAPFLFEHLIEWFCLRQKKYDFLCLFITGNKPENQKISQEILKNNLFIDRVTGNNICFFFCGASELEGFCDDFTKWNLINKDEIYKWSVRKSLFRNLTWKDCSESFREDVCSTYHIQRSILPALIFIDKENIPFLYKIDSYKDIQSLWTHLGIISDYLKDRADFEYDECKSACVRQFCELGFDRENAEFIVDAVENRRVRDWLTRLLGTCKNARTVPEVKAEKTLKCFIAGAKCLEKERNAIISGVNDFNLANCSSKYRIDCYSFQNFDSSLSRDGQQQQYNEFIVNNADLCIFILDEVVGGITKQEFDIAIDTFISSNYNRPTILVFFHKDTNAHGHDKDIEQIKQRMTQLQQYWIDYSDLVNLKNSLQLELYKLYANKE